MIQDPKNILKECQKADEPVFILRASDICSIPALREYFDACCKIGCDHSYRDELISMLLEFELYKHKNLTIMPRL